MRESTSHETFGGSLSLSTVTCGCMWISDELCRNTGIISDLGTKRKCFVEAQTELDGERQWQGDKVKVKITKSTLPGYCCLVMGYMDENLECTRSYSLRDAESLSSGQESGDEVVSKKRDRRP